MSNFLELCLLCLMRIPDRVIDDSLMFFFVRGVLPCSSHSALRSNAFVSSYHMLLAFPAPPPSSLFLPIRNYYGGAGMSSPTDSENLIPSFHSVVVSSKSSIFTEALSLSDVYSSLSPALSVFSLRRHVGSKKFVWSFQSHFKELGVRECDTLIPGPWRNIVELSRVEG
jgi:hypothetical protein